jgi:hypothetical protein
LSIAHEFENSRDKLLNYLQPVCSQIEDWSSIRQVLPFIPQIVDSLDTLIIENIAIQSPLVMQPIWKTVGKTSKLYQNCLDIFVWSNFGFTRLFFDITKRLAKSEETIQRPMRSVVWLAKMLYEFALVAKINHKLVIDTLTYNTKNDKAFALSGSNTRPYMTCDNLVKPRITKEEIKNIILGGGQNFLSRERSYLQTFPDNFIFAGSKTDLEQMIGNAVPVKLAEYVAKCLLMYIEDYNKYHISNVMMPLTV